MKKTRVVVTIKKDILDPAGAAVKNALQRQGISSLSEVRIGKVIDIVLKDGASTDDHRRIEHAARLVLSNPVMEDYQIELTDEFCNER